MSNVHECDILILGGGIAGMTAAVYAAKANYSCVMLDTNITGGLANSTNVVENYPGFISVNGMELMQLIRDQVDNLGVTVEEACMVEKIDLTGKVKKVETDMGTYSARAVIVATGREPIPLDIPTEAEEIHYCAICDGPPYKNKNILIVGGGNSSFDEGLYLKQLGVNEIHIIEIMDRFFAAQSAQDKLLGMPGVHGYKSTKCVDVEAENGRLKRAVLEDSASGERRTLDVDGIFVFLGQRPRTEMFSGILNLNKQGYIEADASMRTNIDGVFAAGDVTQKDFRQLTTAAADGTIAALMADRYLRTL